MCCCGTRGMSDSQFVSGMRLNGSWVGIKEARTGKVTHSLRRRLRCLPNDSDVPVINNVIMSRFLSSGRLIVWATQEYELGRRRARPKWRFFVVKLLTPRAEQLSPPTISAVKVGTIKEFLSNCECVTIIGSFRGPRCHPLNCPVSRCHRGRGPARRPAPGRL